MFCPSIPLNVPLKHNPTAVWYTNVSGHEPLRLHVGIGKSELVGMAVLNKAVGMNGVNCIE